MYWYYLLEYTAYMHVYVHVYDSMLLSTHGPYGIHTLHTLHIPVPVCHIILQYYKNAILIKRVLKAIWPYSSINTGTGIYIAILYFFNFILKYIKYSIK